MYPDIINIDWLLFSFLLSLSLLFLFFLFRKKMWNIIDPLVPTIFYISINFAISAYFFIVYSLELQSFYFILLALICFVLGFRLNPFGTMSTNKNRSDYSVRVPTKIPTIYFLFISILFISVNHLFILRNTGFGVLTGNVNPDIIKQTLTQGGYGIIRHLSVAGGLLFLPLLFQAFFVHKLKMLSFLCVLWFFVTSLFFSFSKAGFVFMLFDIGILTFYYKKALKKDIISLKLIGTIGFLGIIPALIVLLNITERYGVSIAHLILERFVAASGGTYQYFVLNGSECFDDLSFTHKLYYYFDTLLSTLKLKEWEEISYMGYMANKITGSHMPGFGANPYFFLDSHFLFGWFGLIYCFLLGSIVSFTRNIRVNIILFYLTIQIVWPAIADPNISQARLLALFGYIPFLLLYWIASMSLRLGKNERKAKENCCSPVS